MTPSDGRQATLGRFGQDDAGDTDDVDESRDTADDGGTGPEEIDALATLLADRVADSIDDTVADAVEDAVGDLLPSDTVDGTPDTDVRGYQ